MLLHSAVMMKEVSKSVCHDYGFERMSSCILRPILSSTDVVGAVGINGHFCNCTMGTIEVEGR